MCIGSIQPCELFTNTTTKLYNIIQLDKNDKTSQCRSRLSAKIKVEQRLKCSIVGEQTFVKKKKKNKYENSRNT